MELIKKEEKKAVLSICIPTYNRGEILKSTIDNIIEYSGSQIEIIVSDNNSLDNTEKIVQDIGDERIKYYKNTTNKGFIYNLIKVMEYASADFVLLLSDEDDLIIENMNKIIQIIIEGKNLSMIFPAVQKKDKEDYYGYEDVFYSKGKDAFLKHSFSHHYMSGIIFNKTMIDFNELWAEYNKVNHGYLNVYPHVFVLNNLCFKGDVKTLSMPICKMRDLGVCYMDKLDENNYSHPKSRIDQFYLAGKSLIKYDTSNEDRLFLFYKLYRGCLSGIYNYNKSLNDKKYLDYFNMEKINFHERKYVIKLNELALDVIKSYNLTNKEIKKHKNKILRKCKWYITKYHIRKILRIIPLFRGI